MGPYWHVAGMRLAKHNTFQDLLASAQTLIAVCSQLVLGWCNCWDSPNLL